MPSGSVKNAMWQTPVSRVAGELDALGLELGARPRDVVDAQGEVAVLLAAGTASRPARAPRWRKHVSPAHTSKRARSSGRSPSVST